MTPLQLRALLGVAALVSQAAIETDKAIGSLKLINTSCFLSRTVATGISLAFFCLPFRLTRRQEGNCSSGGRGC